MILTPASDDGAPEAASTPSGGPDDAAGRLWLSCLEEIGRRSGHEVRNALNGVSVNLEVVRARADRAGAASVGRFAGTAAEQLELLTRLTEALLALLRPAPASVELAEPLERLVTLLGAAARAEGGDLTLEQRGGPARTALAAATVRPLLAGALLAAGTRSARLCCELDGAGAPALRLRSPGGTLPAPSASLVALADAAGVRADWRPDGWTMIFPPPAG